VADPTLPQKTGKQMDNWVPVLFGVLGIWMLFCLGAFLCTRKGAFAGATTTDCDDEPDRFREPEKYLRWKRDCEDRTRTRTGSKLSLAFSDADITKYHSVAT